jgi:hypothetical protein
LVPKFDFVVGDAFYSHQLIEPRGTIFKALIMGYEQRVLAGLEFRLLLRVTIIDTLTTIRAVKRDVI